jgi:hypothetical protein
MVSTPLRMLAAALLSTAGLAALPARADLVLNEVLYDPAGTDDGAEFVEIWNPDDVPRALAGLTVEAGDGARPDAWATIFRGAPGDTVPPRSAFLVAGAALTGELQNGPDAARLLRDGVVLDLLGWGELEAPALYEGAPAPDVTSGHSLARRDDGRDTGSNAIDWAEEAAPTPGRANHPDERIALTRGVWSLQPAVPWPGESVTLSVRVRNLGTRSLDAARWRLHVEAAAAGAPEESAAASPAWDSVIPIVTAPGVALAPAESATVDVAFPALPPGAYVLRARTAAEGPPAPDLGDTLYGGGRTLAGPAVVTEIAFRDEGVGEWIELWLRDPIGDLGTLAIADAAAAPRPLDRGSTPRAVAAGEWLVVAEEPARVADRFGLPTGSVIGVVGPWAPLNDTPGPDGVADVVRVVETGGVPCDVVPYRSRDVSRGGSLERLSPDLPSAVPGSWGECVDPAGGTPGRANSLRAPGPGSAPRGSLLMASARVLRRGAGAAPLLFRLTAEARGLPLTVEVRDLLGRRRRVLVRGQRFATEGAFAWDGLDDEGRPVPPGLYVVYAETSGSAGVAPRVTTLPVAVAPGAAR